MAAGEAGADDQEGQDHGGHQGDRTDHGEHQGGAVHVRPDQAHSGHQEAMEGQEGGRLAVGPSDLGGGVVESGGQVAVGAGHLR